MMGTLGWVPVLYSGYSGGGGTSTVWWVLWGGYQYCMVGTLKVGTSIVWGYKRGYDRIG